MKKILAIAVATAISAPAMADLTIGGSTEFNLKSEDSTTTHDVETNVQFTASTTADNGMFVKAFVEIEAAESQTNGIDTDDNYLQIGNAAANVIVGEKAASVAWIGGDDSFEATQTTSDTLYTAENLDSLTTQDTILNITAVEGLTLQVSGNAATSGSDTMGVYAAYTAGGFTLAGNVVSSDTSTEDGYALSASTTLGEAAVAVSFASNDAEDTGVALNVGFGAFDVTYARFDDKDSGDETSFYGAYNVGDLGLSGLNIDLGAGSGSDRESLMGVEVTYSF
ncbi:hypothetical protein XMG59_000385 [Marinobacterium sp. xm-g-59]|uniref:porin n=1 Tax=Marinobacterium sp. xm-g-59 TaxID=2497748 RepID=UPI001568A1DF|nr:porin [Marinobacterium sp. xm-g-59]NRP94302.1 hypothetical protein [Marinobacterium sp. xm-g-59]